MKQVTFNEAMHWKYPEWVVLVVSLDEEGHLNAMPAGWAMICSGEPPMFAVAIHHGNYTHGVIARRKEFVVAFPSRGMEDDILYCGTHSARDGSKLEHTDLRPVPATVVRTSLLEGCRINLECELEGQFPSGDHSIFVGRVVAAHLDPDAPPNLVNFGDSRFCVAQPES